MKQKLLVLLAFLNYSAASWQYGTCSGSLNLLSSSDSNSNTNEKCFDACRAKIVSYSSSSYDPWNDTWCCYKEQSKNNCQLIQHQSFSADSSQTDYKGMAITTDSTFSGSTSPDCSSVIDNVSSSQAFTTTLYYGSTSPQNIYPSSSSTDWNTIFGNTDSSNCPITECQLRREVSGSCSSTSTPYFDASNSLAMDSTNLIVQATIASSGSSVLDQEICVECQTSTSGFKQWYIWTVEFKQSPCSSCLSSPSAAASTTLTLDTTTTTEIIYPASSAGFTWDSYFQNTHTSTCALTSCKIYDQSTCSTEQTSPISMASSSPWAVTAQKNVLAGYSITICVKCTNGNQEVSKDWTISLSACQNSLSGPSSSVQSVTQSYDSSSTPIKIYPTTLASDFTTWANYFPNSRSGDCALTSCSLYQSGCTTAFSGSEITIDSTSPWDVKMLRNVPAGYTYTICVKCTNGHQYVEINNWSVTLNQDACLTAISDVSSSQAFTSTLYYGSTSPQTIYPSSSSTDWNTIFGNTDSTNCPITECRLWTWMSPGCSTSMGPYFTESINSLDMDSTKLLAQATIGPAGTTEESDPICVECKTSTSGFKQWYIWTVEFKQSPCGSCLSSPSAAASTTLTLDTTTTTEIIYPASSSGFTWDSYFQNTHTSTCALTSCKIYDQSTCSTEQTSPISMASSSPWAVTAQKNVLAGYSITICVKCTNGNQEVQKDWTVSLSACQSCLSSPSAAASTTLTLDTTTTTEIIYPASSSGFTWDSYFSNTKTSDCALTSCKIYDQSTCSTEQTQPISMASSSQWAVTAQKNVLAGYSITICVKCTNGNQEVSKDWTVSLSACQNSLSGPSSSAWSVTQSYDSSSTPIKIYPTILASDFTTWANYFPNSRSSDCALTSCSLYQSGCTTAFSGSEITIDSASPWDVKMLRNVPAGYTYTICVKCTNGHQDVEINNWSVTLNEANCYNVFTDTTGQSASHDSGTLSWSATSSSQVIRPTSSAWTSWDSYFSMWHTADCAISSCSLYEVGCSSTLTSTSHITIGGSTPWDVTASKSTAAAAGYSVTFCVKCTNGLQTVQQDNWSVALPDCQNKLTVPSAAASSGPLTYSDTDGATIEVTPTSSFTNWNEYFGYSGGDCGITSCSLFSQGCTTALSDPVAMDPTTFKVNALLKKPSGYTLSMCVQCTNGAQTVQKDSWTVTLPACDSVLSNPATLPSPIVIPYANDATKVSITPITPWVSFDSYFNSNPTNCPLTNCHFKEEGCSDGLSGHQTATVGTVLIGISNTDPQSNPTMTAVQNWPAGYSYKVCIYCRNGATNNYLRWWEISQTACDDVLTAPTASYTSTFAYHSTAGSVETVTPSASFTTWDNFFGATDCPITTCSIAETNGGTLNYVTMDATTFAVTANKDVVAGYSEQVTVTCSNGATSKIYASWTVQQTKRCHNAFQYPTGPVASVNSGTLQWSLSTTSQIIEPQSSFTDYDTYFGSQSASATCKISACFLFEAGCSTALPAASPVSISSLSVSAKRDVTAGYTETFCIKCRYNSVDFVQQDQWQVAQSTCLNTLNPSPPAADTLTIGYDSTTPAEIKPSTSFTAWNAFYSLSDSNCPIVECILKQQGCANNLASPDSTQITIDASTPWKIYAKTDDGFGYSVTFCVKCNNGAQFVQIDNWAVTLTRCDNVLTPPTSAYHTSISYSSVNTWTNVFPADTTTTWEVFFSNSKPTLCPITSCNYKYIDSSGALLNGGVSVKVEMDSSTWVVRAKVDDTQGYTRLIRIICCNGATCGTYDKWTIQQTFCQSNGLSVPGGSIPDSNLKFDATTTTEIVYPQSATWPTDHWDTFFSNPDIPNCPITSCSIYKNDCTSSLTSLDPAIVPTISSGSPFNVVAKKNVPAGYSITICVKCQNGYQTIQQSGWKIVQQGCDTISTPASLTPETYIEYDTSNQIQLQVTPATPWVSWDSFFNNQNIADCIITTCQIYGSDCSSPVSGSYITMAASTPWAVTMDRNVASGYSFDVCVKCGNTAVFAEDIWKITLGINACKIYHANGVSNQTFFFRVNETVAIDQSTIDSWFSVEDGNPSSPVCQITHYSVKTDQACTTYYTGSDGTFDNTSGQYVLTLDTSQPTEQRNVFMCVKHRVNNVEQYVQISYQVCGLEQLSLKTSSEFLIKSYAVDSGMKEITMAFFENKFESSIPGCPIVSYKLVQKNENTNQYEDYDGIDLNQKVSGFSFSFALDYLHF